MNNFAAYVDLDVHKDTITVAIAAAKTIRESSFIEGPDPIGSSRF